MILFSTTMSRSLVKSSRKTWTVCQNTPTNYLPGHPHPQRRNRSIILCHVKCNLYCTRDIPLHNAAIIFPFFPFFFFQLWFVSCGYLIISNNGDTHSIVNKWCIGTRRAKHGPTGLWMPKTPMFMGSKHTLYYHCY